MEFFCREFYDAIHDTFSLFHDEHDFKRYIEHKGIRTFRSLKNRPSAYIHENIVRSIKKYMRYSLTCTIHSLIDIDMEVIGKTKKELLSYTKNIIFVIDSYIRFIYSIYKSLPLAKPMKLYIYLTDEKKQIHGKNTQLSPLHINTGYTLFYPNSNYNEIVVYRKEEIIKVLIHEFTHYFMIDQIRIPYEMHRELQTIFGVTNDLHLQESITDFWACFINAMYFAVLKGDIYNYNTFLKNIAISLQKENIFIQQQARKIAYIQNHCWNRSRIREKTHAISYYIIKAIMYKHFDDYIRDYKTVDAKTYFITNIIKDVRNYLPDICDTGLRMSSLDVMTQMKTI